jgi:hypothetical protein
MRALLPLLLLSLPAPAWALPQNSGERIRVAPTPAAARAGQHLPWQPSLEAALEVAAAEERPLLWYVPTLAGSFMDRKPEIDRVQLAGPYSWPRLDALLREEFILLRHAPDRAECERYGIQRYGFVEPGFIVLGPDGTELARHAELTTLHPAWFEARLLEVLGREASRADGLPTRRHDEAALRLLRDPELTAEEREVLLSAAEDDARAEGLHLAAAGAFWRGDEEAARVLWGRLLAEFPEHSLAAKAAMELEGHGGVVRGQEVYEDLPAEALAASGHGSRCAEGVYSLDQAWQRSVAYLLAMQREDGGWKDSIYDFGGTDGLPNVQVAVSAIAARGLLEARQRGVEHPGLEAGLRRALRFLLDEGNLNREDSDELIWAYTYRAQTLARWLELLPEDAEAVRPGLLFIGQRLLEEQKEDGSWAHEYSNPFVTAEGLLALRALRDARVEVPGLGAAVARGTAALLRCRTEEGAYTYGNVREGRRARAQVEGGVGRIPRGELALHAWSAEGARPLAEAVAASLAHEEHLLPAQKYDDHTRSFAYGGFFFFYDLQARTQAMRALADEGSSAARAQLAEQRAQVLSFVEIDGAFIDSHEIGRCYGTGMALWSLALTER